MRESVEPIPPKKPAPAPDYADDRAARPASPKSAGREEKLSRGSDFLDHWREERRLDEGSTSVISGADDPEYAPLQNPVSLARKSDARYASDEPEPASVPGGFFSGRSGIRARPRRYRMPARMSPARMGVIAGGISVVAAIVLVSTQWASLTVVYKPRVDDVSVQEIQVAFDTGASKIQVPDKIIPAEELVFTKKSEQSFSATGRQQVADRARGKAAIVNEFSSSPQALVAGTRFVGDGGLVFRLSRGVTVPGATIEGGKIVPQSVEAELVADAPGERFNTGAQTRMKIPGFQGTPKYDAFYATSAGFSGGFVGESSVVSADDLKKAQEQVTKTLFDDMRSEIGRATPPGFTSLKELQNIEITRVSAPDAGAHTGQFSVSAEASARVMVFREQDAAALIAALALTGSEGHEPVENSAQAQYRVRSVDFDKGKAVAVMTANVKMRAVIRDQEFVALVAGKKDGSIADALRARPEIESFRLSLFPPWRTSAPSDPVHIRFRLE